ncbi:hypothetical protein GOP47_0003456 [Adiantum capillus-veneris]|uniref:Uncharacterized protein n=1 Tax=Adiantum capillus-veneris TaxID=13818 RepID=A0A9D4VCH1_ADICA|nr:hypothetical protein GOP47_0003456 [Adiantum capillus-veneris]
MESSPGAAGWGNVQDLGICGVVRQSISVLCTRAKLFAAIALTLTLPLCFIILAHYLAIDPLVSRIRRYEENPVVDSSLRSRITADRIRLGLLLAAYVLLVLAFALLSTAATVYSVACIYTKRPLTFRKVLCVLPKVWRRLLITFLWAFVFVFFLVGAFLSIVLFVYLVFYPLNRIVAEFLWWLVSFLFAAAIFHFTCVFNLASVVSVLEESNGIRALKKSNNLIKGKRIVAYCLYAYYLIFTAAVVVGFDFASIQLSSAVIQVLIAVVFAVLLAIVNQLGIVIFTILYFTCKAYHHESIDMLALSEHLGAYAGEYVNLRASVQMEGMQRA